jgi:hypothetical protein
LDQATDWAVPQSWSGLVEVMPKGVNKGIALDQVCRHLEISLEDTVAVGDQENDSAMIQAAGLGIAVANAHEGLKEIADAVTVSHRESAIAKVIERYCMEE